MMMTCVCHHVYDIVTGPAEIAQVVTSWEVWADKEWLAI